MEERLLRGCDKGGKPYLTKLIIRKVPSRKSIKVRAGRKKRKEIDRFRDRSNGDRESISPPPQKPLWVKLGEKNSVEDSECSGFR